MLKISSIPQIENPFKEKLIKSQEIICHRPYQEQKSNKKMINNKLPVSIFNSCLSPNQSNKDFSVKMENTFKGKLDINNALTISPFQQNIHNRVFSSNNLVNSFSDLCTSASFSSQKSSESFYSTNNNKNIPSFAQKNIIIVPTNLNIYQSPTKMPSSLNYRIDLKNTNYFYNRNFSSKALSSLKNNNTIVNQKNNQNFASAYFNNNNISFIRERKISNFNINNNFNNNITINNEINFFNNQKSINFSDQNNLINDEVINIDSLNGCNLNKINGLPKNNNCENNINNENKNRKKSKNYYNKFNTAKENYMNENTVILTLKVKVAKNDIRIFNLKKYDDLFVSLEKFVDINKIRQELVKPLVYIIFHTLNKIFSLFNNKIGIYDQKYLNSLYKLWIKNNKEIPKTRNKNHSDKSTTSSSDSSGEKSHKDIKSNSYQNSDNNSYEDDRKQCTSNSF